MDTFQEVEVLRHDLRALSKENDQLLQENRRLQSYVRHRLGLDLGHLESGDGMPCPHILRLPDELLSMVVDFYLNAGRPYLKRLKRLKQLRLVHSRFAQLESVMKTLFRKILVGPHRCTVDSSLLNIAQLVRQVDIKPVLIEVQTAYGDRDDPGENELYNDHLISPWRTALTSGATGRAMAKVFDLLRHGKAFSIHIWSSTDLFPNMGYPGGAEIYASAFEAFTLGDIRPSELTISMDSNSGCGPTWQCSDGVWNNVNFNDLRTLRFEGIATEMYDDQRHTPELPALLLKSAASLQHVVFDVPGLILLRPPPGFPMPALRKVSVIDTQIKFPEFSNWIGQCAVLRELSITHSGEIDESEPVAGANLPSLTVWLPLFTSIRTHSSRMEVKFNPLAARTFCDSEDDEQPAWDELHFIYVNHNTIQACHEKSFKRSDNDDLNKRMEAVINYMSNAGEWTLEESD